MRQIFEESTKNILKELSKGFELSEKELEVAKIDLENLKATLDSEQNKMTSKAYGSKPRKSWYESYLDIIQ